MNSLGIEWEEEGDKRKWGDTRNDTDGTSRPLPRGARIPCQFSFSPTVCFLIACNNAPLAIVRYRSAQKLVPSAPSVIGQIWGPKCIIRVHARMLAAYLLGCGITDRQNKENGTKIAVIGSDPVK